MIWEENKNILIKMNETLLTEKNQNDIIIKIESGFVEKECKHIWRRECPICKKEIFHTNKCNYKHALHLRLKCKSCARKSFDKEIIHYSRECPRCHEQVFYSNKWKMERAKIAETICKRCYQKSVQDSNISYDKNRSCCIHTRLSDNGCR